MSNCSEGIVLLVSTTTEGIFQLKSECPALILAGPFTERRRRDERLGWNFAWPFQVPLTVWVGKFFKSRVQGLMSKAAGSVLSLPGGCRFEALAFRLFGQPVGRHRDRIRVGHGGHRARNPRQPACRRHLDFKHFHHAQLIAEVKHLHFSEAGRGRLRPGPLSCWSLVPIRPMRIATGNLLVRKARFAGQPAVEGATRRPKQAVERRRQLADECLFDGSSRALLFSQKLP